MERIFTISYQNKINKAILLCIATLFFHCIPSYSQSRTDSLLGQLNPQKYAASIGEKSKKLEDKLVKESLKTLSSMENQESKIYKKLLKGKDSLAAKASLEGAKEKYASLKDNLRSPKIVSAAKQYVPHLDSAFTSLKFLDANGVSGKVKDALAKCESMQGKLQQAEEIKKFIRERRELLKQKLEGLGIMKHLKKMNKQVFYYGQQLREYKAMLQDPKKIEKKALELLSKTKVFRDFMAKNSVLGSLFHLSNDASDPAYAANVTGLQTRMQVSNIVQQQLGGSGPNVQQQMQAVQSQLQTLKNKISSGGGSSDDDMPNFKPNGQKTKSFAQRLELGTNLQTKKASNFFPNSADLGLSLGYKISDRSVIGVGASYKMGTGTGWRNIRITNEGVGLRSYLDWKIKGSVWMSGGFEFNHNNSFERFDQLKDLNAWQQSGLIGLCKKYQLSKKIKGSMKLLWDFMSYQQIPKTQAIIFRLGYSLK